MLKFPIGKPKTPFINDQRIWYLQAPPALAKQCLEPELFALAREARKKDHKAFATHQMPAGCEWKLVPDRARFLIDPGSVIPGSRLLCLTIDAGIGKTTAMIQAQSLRGGWLKGHLVIAAPFDALPESSTEYCGIYGWLVDRLIENFEHSKTPDRETAWKLIRRKITTGQFSLIVDSLDQTSEGKPQRRAEGLATFLDRICPTAQCIVSGRPQSIETYWTKLFEQSGPWLFAQIDQFDADQRKKFLGEDRAALLERLEADVVSNPRMLEMILKIPDGDLPKIQTAADIYWRAMNETLKEDIRRQQAGVMETEPALFWFSLLAFASLRQGYTNGVPKGEPMRRFLEDVRKTYAEQIQEWLDDSGIRAIKNELKRLGQLNSFIEHAVLNTSDTLTQLKFRDRSIKDFFAALWISKYASTPDQQLWLRKQLRPMDVIDPNVELVIDQRESQFFRLAAGMPADAIDDGEIWVGSMSVVYESSPYRSTELIYRCWPNLLRLAGFSTPEQVFEMDQVEPTAVAQREVRSWVDQMLGSCRDDAETKAAILETALNAIQPVAKRVIYRYLSEFPAMLHGVYGADKQRIAQDFDDWFVPVPLQEGAPLVCTSCDDKGKNFEIRISRPFFMAKYQVTNELMALFAAGNRTSKEDDPVTRARCAAANINWYDAWSAALFFHGRLPTEDEWEYACRGRPGKVDDPWNWCFGNTEADLEKYALYNKSWGHYSESVGGRLPWAGLYDMHGNVWEWCASWYADNRADGNLASFVGESRCLRGGSFFNLAAYCRCAYRVRLLPIGASRFSGFRVARA